jgi:hypothetical protein
MPVHIRGVSKFRVKYFSFCNQLYNIIAGSNNTLVAGGVSQGSIPQGYYTHATLVAAIDALVPGILTAGPDGALNWTLGSASIDLTATTMRDVLGLSDRKRTYTGTFTTYASLATPQSVCLYSPQLTGPERERVVHAGLMQHTLQSFLNVPVTAPHGSVDTYMSDTESPVLLDKQGAAEISKLQILVVDPSTERELTEVGNWTLLLELV